MSYLRFIQKSTNYRPASIMRWGCSSIVSKEIIGKFNIVMDCCTFPERRIINDCLQISRYARNMIVNTGGFINIKKRLDGNVLVKIISTYRKYQEIDGRLSI